ncbi:hypothetical protein PR003_g12943 [Phytophthora rubi]|uniref:Uncharacterized protein n=1 Tax=Phytophthora rubi TaxID=129364 RepID=A0A6A3MDX4_9STRA|nr:hypothetical protein PR002_g11417 [Phytophthora rubi]KAE9026393.1 hypothetical protein PR001_g12207 [Phytophthora rubi]KAE9335563.1 hypothetical protein PR003_g12943 [Phytophthora rubi]
MTQPTLTMATTTSAKMTTPLLAVESSPSNTRTPAIAKAATALMLQPGIV